MRFDEETMKQMSESLELTLETLRETRLDTLKALCERLGFDVMKGDRDSLIVRLPEDS